VASGISLNFLPLSSADCLDGRVIQREIAMSQIIIRTRSRRAAKGIEDLIAELNTRQSNFDVKHVEIKRSGIEIGGWFELISIFIAVEVSKTVIKNITEAAIKWAKDRMELEGDNSESRYIPIFGPDGVPIVAKQVKPSGEVEDITHAQQPERFPTHLL
jgi:hypothetical protein